ncbi:hypothetical protein H8S55_00750 [Flintibacter sp. BX5]|uniref:Uncharacterized protein n=1 Tax=Flintibacter faecis TaxID=2763047 RepID=A0A8J6J274_9FIRM|nr:hypothetical protein [Flintibacter faecis]
MTENRAAGPSFGGEADIHVIARSASDAVIRFLSGLFFEKKTRKACNIFLLSFVYFSEAQNRPDGYRSILRIS